MRAEAFALIIIAWLGTLTGAYVKGCIDTNAARDAEQAAATIDAGRANLNTQVEVGARADQLARVNLETQQEAADARREFETWDAPIAAGRVGPGALVDPDYALALLCRIERVRGTSEERASNCARRDADAGAAQ